MNDTHLEIRKIYHKMLMEKSNEERMRMGFSMFESAKKMILCLINNNKNVNAELFKRIYKDDFNKKKLKEIIRCIKKYKKNI